MIPASFGLLWFGFLKAITGLTAAVVLVFFALSLGPAVWADPPDLLRPRAAAPESADAVALFRAAAKRGPEAMEEEARAALAARFPPGSDATALVAFLTDAGTGGEGLCQPLGAEYRHRGYRCHVWYGSLAASILDLDRWRAGEWVVGIEVAPDSDAIQHLGVRIPPLGKG